MRDGSLAAKLAELGLELVPGSVTFVLVRGEPGDGVGSVCNATVWGLSVRAGKERERLATEHNVELGTQQPACL